MQALSHNIAMDRAAILREVEAWPPSERFEFIELMWDRLLSLGFSPPITKTQGEELEKRIASSRENATNTLTWKEVKDGLGTG